MVLAGSPARRNPEFRNDRSRARELLTPEEFASLIEVAVTSPNPKIPAPHLTKLITLGYVAVTAKGPVVTGDGLMRITKERVNRRLARALPVENGSEPIPASISHA
jgi:hypothetical protein